MTTAGDTIKFNNQKNSKGVFVHQEHNNDAYYCVIRDLGCRYFHIWHHTCSKKTLLPTFFGDGVRQDVTDQKIRDRIKWMAK